MFTFRSYTLQSSKLFTSSQDLITTPRTSSLQPVYPTLVLTHKYILPFPQSFVDRCRWGYIINTPDRRMYNVYKRAKCI